MKLSPDGVVCALAILNTYAPRLRTTHEYSGTHINLPVFFFTRYSYPRIHIVKPQNKDNDDNNECNSLKYGYGSDDRAMFTWHDVQARTCNEPESA